MVNRKRRPLRSTSRPRRKRNSSTATWNSKLESLASDTLREQLVQARARIADLEFAARSKDVNLRRMTDQVAILIVNISSLYHTAKVEMERKDALIRQLQSELQARKM